jgi:hypothetical protein
VSRRIDDQRLHRRPSSRTSMPRAWWSTDISARGATIGRAPAFAIITPRRSIQRHVHSASRSRGKNPVIVAVDRHALPGDCDTCPSSKRA